MMMRNRRNRSKTDLESIKRFRKFRNTMDKLMEEPVTIEENNNVETFHTDEDHLKPLYAVVNLMVGQQQAFVDLVNGDVDER